MVTPSPSLPVLPQPSAGAGRSPVSTSVGRGSVRAPAGRQSFAGVLADQEPADHGTAGTADLSSSPDDGQQQSSPKDAGQTSADAAGTAGKQTSSRTPPAGDDTARQPVSVPVPDSRTSEQAPARTAPQSAPRDDGQDAATQKTADQDASASLETQMLSLAAFMTTAQPTQPAASGQSLEDMVEQTAGSLVAAVSAGSGQTGSMMAEVQKTVAAILESVPDAGKLVGELKQLTSGSIAGTLSSAAGQVLQALSSGATAGSVPVVSDMMQAAVTRAAQAVPFHGQGEATTRETAISSLDAGLTRRLEAAVDLVQRDVQASSATRAAPQGMKDQEVAAVKAMGFQPENAGSSGVSALKGGAGPDGRQDTGRTGHGGQTDSLFGLMVRTSSGQAGMSFFGSGHQEEQGDGQARMTRDGVVSATVADDGVSGAHEAQEVPASFAGQLASLSEGSNVVQQSVETQVPVTSLMPHEAKQTAMVAGSSPLLQTGGGTSGVLSGRSVEQAGTLTMTVRTSDDTSVHVQLDRSAEGLSALSLQGQDDGTTEALQKTHHVLARQLDEAGLHPGAMKIDVLPTDSGQMAGGQDRNMPQQHQGQGAYQPSGQTADQSSFQQAGGFSAGGDGGAGRQGHQARQGETISAPSRPEPAFGQEEDSPASTASPSGRVGHLNISV